MLRHHQPNSADPPLTPEQRVIVSDLVMHIIKQRGYESAVAAFGALHDGTKSVPQIQAEWQERRTEPGGLIAQAFAELEEEFKGMAFPIRQSVILFFKRLFGLESWEVEQLLHIPYVRQTEYRIMQKAEMRPRRRTTQGKGGAL